MIKKLDSNTGYENKIIINYLTQDKHLNTFILGDIFNFGFQADYLDIWSEFDENNNCRGVLLRFFNYYIFYSQNEFDVESFTKIITNDKNALSIAGSTDLMFQFHKTIPESVMLDGKYAKLGHLNETYTFSSEAIHETTVKDIDEIVSLRNSIEEFKIAPFMQGPFKEVIHSKAARCYYVKKADKIVCMAATRVETDKLSIVGSICTASQFRHKGLATDCTYKLCKDLVSEGKDVCLFYSAPEAESIYKKMGFIDIGTWTMLMLPQS